MKPKKEKKGKPLQSVVTYNVDTPKGEKKGKFIQISFFAGNSAGELILS